MSKKVIVIGAGPGGYPTALALKELGAEVTIVEKNLFGGTCLNRGCIPSKAFLDTAHRVHSFEGLKKLFKDDMDFKFSADMLDWEKIKARRSEITLKIRTSLEKLFQSKKIEVIKGKASFLSKDQIKVITDDGEIKKDFDYAVLATGTKPSFPPPFKDNPDLITDSDRIFDLPYKPKNVLIVGAGVIGLEFACFFNAIGVNVTILEIMPDLLLNEDIQVRRAVRSSFEKRGIRFIFGKKANSIHANGNIKTIALENGEKLEADTVLVGAGRVADLSECGLENIGLEWNRKGVKTDMCMKTDIPNVYAVGDVNGISLLAHSAEKQGDIVAGNIMNYTNISFDDSLVPKCIYAWPEVGSVGLNKEQAEAKGINAKTARTFNLAIGRAVASDETEGFTQIVYNAENDVIIGAQIVGGPATELIHIMALAIKMNLTRSDLKEMIFAHPTMAEAIKETLSK